MEQASMNLLRTLHSIAAVPIEDMVGSSVDKHVQTSQGQGEQGDEGGKPHFGKNSRIKIRSLKRKRLQETVCLLDAFMAKDAIEFI